MPPSAPMSLSDRPLLQALLAFALVLLRGRPGLLKLSDPDFRFVAQRAKWVSIGSTTLLFLPALLAIGDLGHLAVIAGSAWGTVCLVKVQVLLATEDQRRARHRPPG